MIDWRNITIPVIILLIMCSLTLAGSERFPPPEFEGDYELPSTTEPAPRDVFYDYMDVAVLFGALVLSSYLALKNRSRRAIFILTIFSLIYFGFWRKGCICSIGAIQNVVYSFFEPEYTVPVVVLIFFLLPLVFTLFFGRTFCSSVCPLGAIQDVVLLRPVSVPVWAENGLRMLAYLYLGAAVLFAATGSAFVICRYDPFVSFFRLSGNFNLLVLGACFLIIGLFVGRP
ncbi:4Fe-4S binding protein, partial [Planctomycetota bacterium]